MTDPIEEIVAGDVKLKGPFFVNNEYILDISNEANSFFTHLSLREGRVMAHLMNNENKAISMDEIREIRRWSKGERLVALPRTLAQYSTSYEIAEIYSSSNSYSYVFRKKPAGVERKEPVRRAKAQYRAPAAKPAATASIAYPLLQAITSPSAFGH